MEEEQKVEKMVMSKQQEMGTDTPQTAEELPLGELLERERRAAYAAGFAEGQSNGFAACCME